jgi:chromosomal replication initiation ATPase DnaA
MTEHIMDTICKHYGITLEELSVKKVRRQLTKVVEAKQVAAYLLWKYTKLTRMEIATLLGYQFKQNINHSNRSIRKIADGNHAFKTELEGIEALVVRN